MNISEEELELKFEKGCIAIFWDGTCLTESKGIYTSILANGDWHESKNSDWIIEDRNSHSIIAVRSWHSIPISQRWILKIKNKHEVQLKISMSVSKNFYIELAQINLMLNQRYWKWTNSSDQGGFPPAFTEEWLNVWSGRPEKGYIGVESYHRKYPLIFLIAKEDSEYESSNIQNTPCGINARCLQFLRIASKKVEQGSYEYFNGGIVVGKPPF